MEYDVGKLTLRLGHTSKMSKTRLALLVGSDPGLSKAPIATAWDGITQAYAKQG